MPHYKAGLTPPSRPPALHHPHLSRGCTGPLLAVTEAATDVEAIMARLKAMLQSAPKPMEGYFVAKPGEEPVYALTLSGYRSLRAFLEDQEDFTLSARLSLF